jgi:hypothetical protein
LTVDFLINIFLNIVRKQEKEKEKLYKEEERKPQFYDHGFVDQAAV